ncbi:MAG: heme peroxidase, partial [Cryobacterium sp.]|nr:heme peroxidase [Cryobacterium sp.]
MATSFTVNKADLQFILRQIKIAEASSAAYNSAPMTIVQAIQAEYGLAPANAAQSPFGLRTTDGSMNSTVPNQEFFGGADNRFPRLTDPVFRNETDGDSIDLNGRADGGGLIQGNYGQNGHVVDADPRVISNLIVDMSVTNPAAIDAFLHNPLAVAAFEDKHGFAPTEAWLTDPAHVSAANTALQTIPNQSPDLGLTASFNSWMTFFGQFFDHGLDFVVKGGNGSVLIPLMPDDPLITLGPDGQAGTPDELTIPALQFMALTRAKTANGVVDGETLNTTTSFVDQNQTYTSHASHQAFLREYVKDANGHAVSTGNLLDGGHNPALGNKVGAIGNWAEVKAQAKEMLGLILTDHDVLNVPLLLTDQYGRFIPGAGGFAQVVTAVHANGTPTAWVEGTATGLSLPVNTIRTGHAFLDDIAHHAAPGFVDANHNGTMDAGEALQTPDSDPGTGDDRNPATYDDELLNAHFITGDGRGNENIALTTVHAIFHAEHNRLVGSNKATILASGDVAFLNQWLLTDQPGNLTAAQVQALNPADLVWDGERLFQAAKFGTEMQYQHLVFEEFARRIQPMVDPFVFNTSPDVDPSVLAEFAHTVYRFGHSMLTGTVDRLENDLTGVNEVIANVEKTDPDQKVLLAVFLNPAAYLASGADMATVNANLVRGLSRDVGNEIDEFVVNTLRTNLLGLPLDLAALNLARGREVGIPSLNDTRAQLYEDTGLTDLKPYTSWADFAEYLKNPMSIVNFIAAYGTHPLIETAETLAGKRALAEELVFGVEADGTTRSDIQDRIAFLNATGDYAGGKLGGLNDVDLWIGGLAEAKPEFGGMLGTTFNYVFEYQMEALQNGDRFYYLTRTQGTNFLNQLEPNSFADLVMRNTALGDKYATHLSGQLFVTPDLFLEQDVGIAQTDYNPDEDGRTRASEDPTWADHEAHPLTRPHKVERFGGTTITENGVDHTVGGTFKFYGPEHVVMGGTEGNDLIYSDRGDDTLWGDAGNDYLNGGTGPDDVFGGDGDDIIEDPFGDDVLRGQNGNDVISDSRGANLLFGDAGQDYVIVGQDATEVFAGTGTDFVLGGNGKDFLLGNEGDDWMEGGGGFDTLAGDNSELFFNSPLVGHDVLFGHGDETDYDAESGDDIMGSGPSVYRYEGMFGFDWGIAKFDPSEIHFDLQIPIFTNAEENVLRDRFDQVEGVSGWSGDDRLDGDDRGHSGGSSSPDSVPVELFTDHTLTQEGMDRIAGLQQLLGGAAVTSFKNGNILLGGDGNDTIRGRGGFDTIDGDAWLNVRIKIVHNGATYAAESLTTDTVVAGPNAGRVFNINPDGSPNFNSVAFEGRSLNSLVLDRTINPGDMSIVREILYDNTNVTGAAKNIDTAMFQGGSLEYDIEGTRIVYDAVTGEALRRVNIGQPGNSAEALNIRDVDGDGFIRVKDLDDGLVAAPGRVGGLTVSRGALTDDVDLLKNMERLQFADTAFNVGGTTNRIATGTVTISDPTPYDFDNNPATPAVVSPIVGQVLTATLSNLQDLDGVPINPATGMPVGLTFDWETTEAGNDGGWAKISSGLTYTVRPVDPAHVLRAVAVFKDSAGVTERIASIQTDNVTAPFSVLEGTRTGTVVAPVPFSLDYDPLGFGGTGVTDGDVVQLTHVIQPGQDAGGRFTIVNTGTATAPVYQLAVANGALLDYEAVQVPVDNQYQIVIDTYTDTIANGGTLMASRQFTILLGNVNLEDIKWGAPPVGGAATPPDTERPGADTVIGHLSRSSDEAGAAVFSLVSATSNGNPTPNFSVSPTGAVTRLASTMSMDTTYVLTVMATLPSGATRTEAFTVKIGNLGSSAGGE